MSIEKLLTERTLKDTLSDKAAQKLFGLPPGTERQWDKLCQRTKQRIFIGYRKTS